MKKLKSGCGRLLPLQHLVLMTVFKNIDITFRGKSVVPFITARNFELIDLDNVIARTLLFWSTS